MTKRFLSTLSIDAVPPGETGKRQRWILTQDFIYRSEALGTFTVPAGFETDFASIPRIAWQYVDPDDPCVLYPSIPHDALYNWKGVMATGQKYTRKQADDVFLEAMKEAGARWDIRAVAYRAVRIFGGKYWNEDHSHPALP